MLTITGSNFGSGTHVWWNGQDRPVLSATPAQITAQITAADVQYVGRASVAVYSSPGAGLSTPASFVVGAAPTIDKGGVVSSANPLSGSNGSPGALITIYGENLAGAPQGATNYPLVFPLPQTFGGVTVIIGNYVAPIYYISSRTINVQVPYELSTRNSNGLCAAGHLDRYLTISMAAVTPALFNGRIRLRPRRRPHRQHTRHPRARGSFPRLASGATGRLSGSLLHRPGRSIACGW